MSYVKCTHTVGNRVQECILVVVADRIACIPIGPAQNAIGKIAAGVAMAGMGIVKIRLRDAEIDVSQLATVPDLDAAIAGSDGFYLGAEWSYRTNVPVIGTMLMRGKDVITTREHLPAQVFTKLTVNRAPPSKKAIAVITGIGGAIVVAAVISFLATGRLELLFGIGFWGVLMLGTCLFAWLRLRPSSQE